MYSSYLSKLLGRWRRVAFGMAVLWLSGALPLAAQTVAGVAPGVTTLVPVKVTGVQPGPGLWRASKDGHVLWILGLTSPLPRQLPWPSQQVAKIMAGSQLLLDPPAVKMKLDVGFFGKLWLLPSLIGVRNNPEGKTLREVVAPADYARWQVLKARYLGEDGKIERWRPIFAAYQLYHRALAQQGLVGAGEVLYQVRQLAAQDKLPRQSTTLTVLLEHPRHLVKSFKHSELDDRECFAQTLDHLETDLHSLNQRAQAWAVGDIEALRAAYADDLRTTCLDSLGEAGFFKQQGLDDVPERQRQHWLQVTLAALAQHRSVFAMLPMEWLLGSHTYLQDLAAAGYQITPPEADPAAAGSSPPAPAAATSAD